MLKKLITKKYKVTGKSASGGSILYNRGGGVKRYNRVIDTKNYIWYLKGLVPTIEYDPCRSSRINLILYSNGILAYTLAINKLKIGEYIWTNLTYFEKKGNKTLMLHVSNKFTVCAIETYAKNFSQYVKTPNNFGRLIMKMSKMVSIRSKTKCLIRISVTNIVTLGSIRNVSNEIYNKASYYRYRGWKPHVRGVAKNPIDHPLGGGQGKTSGGRPSCNFKGRFIKGVKTRKLKKKKNDSINLKG